MNLRCTQFVVCVMVALLALSSRSDAQITYASTNFASAGDTFLITRVKLDSLGAANFASTGANFTWNYSALRPLAQTTDRFMGATNTGYKAAFIATCVAGGGGVAACNTQWNNLVNLAHKELDSIKYGTYSFGNVVQHYNKTAAVLPANVLGMTFGLNGVNFPMTISYQRPDTIIRFPLTYNKRDSCVSKYSIDLTAQGVSFIYKATAKRVNHVEGWGPLTTPHKNYASTLKQKTTITNTDTVIVNGTVIPVPVFVTVEYNWYELNTKRPVLKVKGAVVGNQTTFSNVEFVDTARCLAPTALFTKTPLVPYLDGTAGNVTVDFTNTSINASTSSWNFGDTASGALNVSSSTHPSHVYSKSGTFMVKLVSCNSKCQPLSCDSVTIPVVIFDSTKVTASFTYYPLQPCAGDTVKFKNQTLNATSYSWSFGDNTTSTLANPEKVYASAGSYNVRLIAVNGASRDTVQQKITINGAPDAVITPSGNFTFCNGDSVTLTASGGTFYQWSNGQITESIKVKTAGAYFVKAFNACGVATSEPDTLKTLNYVTPTIAINSNEGVKICNGQSTTFITFAPFAGTNPVYQWKVNSVNVGTNSNSYTTSGLRDYDTVQCFLTSNYQCRLASNAVSNKIIMEVLPYLTPAVSISASSSIICQGTNVIFFAYPLNGGTTPIYQWKLNNNNVGTNSASYSSTTLATGDVVKCKITSNYQCLNRDTALSPGVTMTVNAVQPTITITANPTGPVCTNTSVTFTANVTNGGAAPTFQWRKNATVVGTNSSTYTNAVWAVNDSIRCTLTSNASCAIPATVTSNTIKMQVGSSFVPTVTISANPGDSICDGTNVVFTAQGTVLGSAPIYKWKVNDIDTGISAATFASAILKDADSVMVVLTSNATCANPKTVNSNKIKMKVMPLVQPMVSIETDTNTVCEGAPVVFRSSNVNGGANPVYDWLVNGQSANAHADTLLISSLADGDVVNVRMTSNATCATPPTIESDGDTMTVLNKPDATITVTGPSAVCEGGVVELSAPDSLVYEWNTGETIRSITVDSTGDYSVIVTDNNLCRATSAPVPVTIYALPSQPVISRTADTLYSTEAKKYQWFRNDTLLAGDTLNQLTMQSDGDYSVEIADSNGCVSKSEIFNATGVYIYSMDGMEEVSLYPNPNSGKFVLSFKEELPIDVRITDVSGRLIVNELVTNHVQSFNFQLLPAGLYFAEVHWDNLKRTIRFTVQ